MPHFGQSPGLSDSTPGHIGQKYFAAEAGFTSPWVSLQHAWDSPAGSGLAGDASSSEQHDGAAGVSAEQQDF
jgi:hypothetical protein